VQIYVSDYTLNSLLRATISLGWLDNQYEFKSSTVASYVGDFETAFGYQEKVRIVCAPVPGEHKVRVTGTHGISKVHILLEMHVKNPFYDTDMDAAVIVLDVDA